MIPLEEKKLLTTRQLTTTMKPRVRERLRPSVSTMYLALGMVQPCLPQGVLLQIDRGCI